MTHVQATFPSVLPPRRLPIPLDRAFPGLRARKILIDPPWPYQNWTEKKNGAAIAHYDGMSFDEMAALPVASVMADDAVALLWCTWPKLEWGPELIRAWGLRYVTCALLWVKTNADWTPYMGQGFYSRIGSEFCLLGVRGSMPVKEHDVLQVMHAPVTGHSVKPWEQYDRIERLWPGGPNLELFARSRRRGWQQWGDEVGPWEATPP